MANIDNSLNNAFSQRQISTTYSPRNQYRIILESPPNELRQLSDLTKIFVPAGVSLQNSSGLGGGQVQTALDPGANNAQSSTNTSNSTSQVGSTTGTQATTTSQGPAALQADATNPSSTTNQASATGQIQLQSMAHVVVGFAPLTVNHEGQFPEVTVTFNLKPGAVQADANDAILKAIADMHLPDSLQGQFTGNSKLFQQSSGSQAILLYARWWPSTSRSACSTRASPIP